MSSYSWSMIWIILIRFKDCIAHIVDYFGGDSWQFVQTFYTFLKEKKQNIFLNAM